MRIGLVIHPERDSAAELAGVVVAAARAQGIEVLARPDDADRVAGATPCRDAFGDCDAILAVGGDGTMLEAVRIAIVADLPILGVNAGHVGFLTEVEPRLIDGAIAALVAGDYRESRRMTLTAHLPDGSTVSGLNDVVLEKRVSQHIVRVAVSVGEERLVEYRADAVIVATPTGSTAYNFSAGGPLVDPELEALMVTAVAPHNLFGRPIVFRPSARLRLTVEGERHARVNVDGRPTADLAPGDDVHVVRGAAAARFIRLTPRHFAAAVREKFRLHDA
jgi:NAD+ kinase